MDKSSLRFCLQTQEVQEDRMNLRRLQELSKIFLPSSYILDTIFIAYVNSIFYIKLYEDSLQNIWVRSINNCVFMCI